MLEGFRDKKKTSVFAQQARAIVCKNVFFATRNNLVGGMVRPKPQGGTIPPRTDVQVSAPTGCLQVVHRTRVGRRWTLGGKIFTANHNRRQTVGLRKFLAQFPSARNVYFTSCEVVYHRFLQNCFVMVAKGSHDLFGPVRQKLRERQRLCRHPVICG